jgi:hypothetical protein
MRRAKYLRMLHERVDERLSRLSSLTLPISGQLDPSARRVIAYTVIECASTWSVFTREYYLSCALLSPWIQGGHRVTYPGVPITTERDALIEAIRAAKRPGFNPAPSVNIKPRDEPNWLSKATLAKISGHLGFSHDTKISNALSYQSTFFSHAIATRNFFAHRGKDSSAKVLNIARQTYLSPVNCAEEFVNTILQGRTDTLINEWLVDIRNISQALCI